MPGIMPTEQQEAETFATWLTIHGYKFTHIPNETGGDTRARLRGLRMKRAGTSKGFPDYLIFANGERIAIELKRQKGGKTSPEQREWLGVLAQYGFHAAVCNGAREAIEFIEEVVRR